MPVWADAFGNEVQKSTWLTYLIISNPIGVVLGYILCATAGWKAAFYIQSVFLFPCFLSLLFTPNKYLDIKTVTREINELTSSMRGST